MIRKARINEVPEIRTFLAERETHGLLPRTLAYVYSHLRDFWVCREGVAGDGPLIGLAAMHLCWDGLGEIRSLVVKEGHQRKGVGKNLVEWCLSEAKVLGIERVFLLTTIPGYFQRFGFKEVSREELHPVVWHDCIACVKFTSCDEIPMALKVADCELAPSW